MNALQRRLVKTGVCPEAFEFAGGFSSFKAAWRACKRPDWLLWWLGRNVPNTAKHREQLTCIAIRMVQGIPNRVSIPVWDTWAVDYLSGSDRTIARAAGTARAVRAAGAAGAAEAARAAGAAIVREYYLNPIIRRIVK